MTLAGADAPDSAYNLAWAGLALVLLYYIAATIFLNWTRSRSVEVTKYEPPPSLSPGIAAYILTNGRCERAFAAALVSLAVKGYLEIRQNKDWYALRRLREGDSSLALEESTILAELFPFGNDTYDFDGKENAHIYRAFQKFEPIAEGIAELELISPHDVMWGVGAFFLSLIVISLAFPLPFVERGDLTPTVFASILFIGFWVILGVYSLMAALRVWPATLRKLASFLPTRTVPRRPLGWNDLFPLSLTATAILGFTFLAAISSARFAILALACGLLAITFRHVLYGPTKEGQRLLADLRGFREFLSRADSDRLNRQNQAGVTPQSLDRYSANAVALDVEHGWGEEFAEDVLEMVQFDRAVDFPRSKSDHNFFSDDSAENDGTPIQLNLKSRK
jgi:hypothetical protein